MILVLGATGFLGQAVCRKLDAMNVSYIGTSLHKGRVDLRNKDETYRLFEIVSPKYVLNCAAYVGGIQFGYKHFAELFSNNLRMTLNILDASAYYKVKRLVNPISNCAYPGELSLFKEEDFWKGPLHESVMVYGFARKASWIGSWAYNKQYGLDQINLILSNMFGPFDHFDEERSHALGALVMKIVEAHRDNLPSVKIWGSGKPVREWLHVDDGAEAMVRALDIAPYADPINIGVGKGISIMDMALLIKEIVGYKGDLLCDLSKPDGAPYKTVDGTLGKSLLGWQPTTDFKEALRSTIAWYTWDTLQGL
jgi:GDP-L-fucose synthase